MALPWINGARQVERDNPKILFLTKEDLTRDQDHKVNEWEYPDHKKIGNLTIPLQYRFEPGHDEDGVTAIIPVHQLNQLTANAVRLASAGLAGRKMRRLDEILAEIHQEKFRPRAGYVKRCLEIEPDFKGLDSRMVRQSLTEIDGRSHPLKCLGFDMACPIISG